MFCYYCGFVAVFILCFLYFDGINFVVYYTIILDLGF